MHVSEHYSKETTDVRIIAISPFTVHEQMLPFTKSMHAI